MERKAEREKTQTLAVSVQLVRGKCGFGLGIADEAGHCIVHRLLRNDYYSPSDLGTQVSTSPKRKAIDAADEDEAEAEELLGPVPVQNKLKINDRIVKVNGELVADYNACIEAVKQTQTILELVILRDPDAAEGKEWLRDRLYNHSKFWYWFVVTVLIVVGLCLAGAIGYGISQLPEVNHTEWEDDPTMPPWMRAHAGPYGHRRAGHYGHGGLAGGGEL